jgi:hypothetical protein
VRPRAPLSCDLENAGNKRSAALLALCPQEDIGAGAMNKPAEYRENAALCLEAMRAAAVPEVRASLQTMAQRWIDLAEHAEEKPRAGQSSEAAPRRSTSVPWPRF